MGAPIAERLAAAGYRVVGFDAAGSDDRVGPGVQPAGSLEEVLDEVDVVALSLPRADISIAVLEQMAAHEARRATTVIDLSTIGLAAAEACSRIAVRAGIDLVDAPLSGGVAGATTGKMAMMASAPTTVIERLRPLLLEIAENLFVVGEQPGHGQAMKLLNNYVSGTALAATFEAVVFGQQVGLDLEQIVEVLNVSSGRTSASTDKLPRAVVPGTYDFGFASAAMRKDVGLYLEGVSELGTSHRLAEASDALWERFLTAHPETDFTYLHKYLQEGGE